MLEGSSQESLTKALMNANEVAKGGAKKEKKK